MMPLRNAMRDKRVAGALAVLAVLFVAYRIYTAVARNPAEAPSPAVQVSAGMETGAHAPGEKLETPAPGGRAPKEIAWSWGRNPFLPLWREGGSGDPAAVGAGENRGAEVPQGLRGTVVSGNTGIAIFGNRLVPLGGAIGEWSLERVDPYGVSLRKGQEVLVVELYKPAPTGARGRGGDR
jgi:hypothetical protein